MIQTFNPSDTQEIKQICLDKVNSGEGFLLIPKKNYNGTIHHWELTDDLEYKKVYIQS